AKPGAAGASTDRRRSAMTASARTRSRPARSLARRLAAARSSPLLARSDRRSDLGGGHDHDVERLAAPHDVEAPCLAGGVARLGRDPKLARRENLAGARDRA